MPHWSPKILRKCHNQLWFNDWIKHEIQICRKKEAMLFKDPNEYNYWAFYYQRRHCSNLIKATQCKYYLDKITDNKNTKVLFNITNTLLGNTLPLPPTQDLKTLAGEFNYFFKDKIAKIMDNLRSTRPTDVNPEYIESKPLTPQVVNEFRCVDEAELMEDHQKDRTKILWIGSPSYLCIADPLGCILANFNRHC